MGPTSSGSGNKKRCCEHEFGKSLVFFYINSKRLTINKWKFTQATWFFDFHKIKFEGYSKIILEQIKLEGLGTIWSQIFVMCLFYIELNFTQKRYVIFLSIVIYWAYWITFRIFLKISFSWILSVLYLTNQTFRFTFIGPFEKYERTFFLCFYSV